MLRKTSLMEWLDQTKKLSKMVDYLSMDLVDDILNNLWLIERKVLNIHKKFFDKLCEKYHKPNPIDYCKTRKKVLALFLERNHTELAVWTKKLVMQQPKGCLSQDDYIKCAFNRFGIKTFSAYVDKSIQRCEKAQKDILWQWFEVIDFMYERPELINPVLIDEYIESCINEVCADNKKNNPLANGMRAKFGKFWKDKDGKWRPEKRNRF